MNKSPTPKTSQRTATATPVAPRIASNRKTAKQATETKAPCPNRRRTASPLTTPATVAIVEPHATKQAQLIALLNQASGASLADLMNATGWQAHSVRGVISGVLRKRLQLPVILETVDGTRRYRIAEPQ
jgi:hypothetical protein